MEISENITREEYSYRGGGCELDLTEYGYEDEFLSAYQNYLGGGVLGSVGNSCTVEGWQNDPKLFELARQLREYLWERMNDYGYLDEYNEVTDDRPVSCPGL
jgi:hypothetical protein